MRQWFSPKSQFDDLEEDSEEESALAELASAVDQIRPYMHSVNLIPYP